MYLCSEISTLKNRMTIYPWCSELSLHYLFTKKHRESYELPSHHWWVTYCCLVYAYSWSATTVQPTGNANRVRWLPDTSVETSWYSPEAQRLHWDCYACPKKRSENAWCRWCDVQSMVRFVGDLLYEESDIWQSTFLHLTCVIYIPWVFRPQIRKGDSYPPLSLPMRVPFAFWIQKLIHRHSRNPLDPIDYNNLGLSITGVVSLVATNLDG